MILSMKQRRSTDTYYLVLLILLFQQDIGLKFLDLRYHLCIILGSLIQIKYSVPRSF